jgi:hypothetical protein
MSNLLESVSTVAEGTLDAETIDSAIGSSTDDDFPQQLMRARAEHRRWLLISGFPVRIVAIVVFFTVTAGVAAALIHSVLDHAANPLFHLAGF